MQKETVKGIVIDKVFFHTQDERKEELVSRYQVDSTKGEFFTGCRVEDNGKIYLTQFYRNVSGLEDIMKSDVKIGVGDIVEITGTIVGHDAGNNIIEAIDFNVIRAAKKPDALSIKEEVEHYSKEDPIS